MRFLLVIGLALTVAAAADAQSSSASTRRTYGRGSVIAGGERFQVQNIVVARDTLTFTIKSTGERRSYPLGRVEYASRTRNHAAPGALVGGGLMLLGGLLGVAQAEADPDLETRDNAAVIVGALTAGGALIGGIIGAALTDEKTIIQNGRFVASLALPIPVPRSSGRIDLELLRIALRF